MKVIAKFRLWEKAQRVQGALVDGKEQANCTLKFNAVKDDIFGPYTPSGDINMVVVQSVGEHFELGKEYLLTFEPFPQ